MRPKLLLIDPDHRYTEDGEIIRYWADLRVCDVAAPHQRKAPLDQFVDGFYCDACGLGFISDQIVVAGSVHLPRKA